MKKSLLFILFFYLISQVAPAQELLYKAEQAQGKAHFSELSKENSFRRGISSHYELKRTGANARGETPFRIVEDCVWDSWINTETGEESFFRYSFDTYKENPEHFNNYLRTLHIYPLDEDWKDAGHIEVALPDYHCNACYIVPERSGDAFAIFIHYFSQVGTGDNSKYQVWNVWIINNQGEIIKKYDDMTSAMFVEGQWLLVNNNDYRENFEATFVDPVTFEENNKITFPQELSVGINGPNFMVTEFEGETLYMTLYYEKTYYVDKETWLFNTGNRLIFDIYDKDVVRLKRIRLEMDQFQKEDYHFPSIAYGFFPAKFDITKDVFNSDSKWEFAMPVFVTTYADGDWYEFYVINEDGDVIKSYEEPVSDFFYQSDLEGFDSQMSFIQADEEGNQSLVFFNIESWEVDATFNARHGEEQDLISVYTTRIKRDNNTYDYMIGLGEPEIVDGTIYGLVKAYNKSGKETDKIMLALPEGSSNYVPSLATNLLDPRLFDTDKRMDYMYTYKLNNNYYVAFSKNGEKEPFLVLEPNKHGTPWNYNFFYEEGTNTPKEFVVNYYDDAKGTYHVYFYELPLVVTEDRTLVAVQVKTNHPTETAEGAEVKLTLNSQEFKATVDKNGKAEFRVSDDGSYTVAISKSKYYPLTAKATIEWTDGVVTVGPYELLMYNTPASLKCADEGDKIELIWTAPEVTAPLSVNGYNVYRNNVKVNSDLVEATTYEDTDVEKGKKYTYYITAIMSDGIETDKSNEVVVDRVGIGQIAEADVKIYPNPSTGIVTVDCATEENVGVSIYNLSGKMVYEGVVNGSNKTIDLGGNASGIYIVRLVTTQGVAVRKLTLNK